MKTVMKKLLSIMLVAILLVSAVPFRASAEELTGEDARKNAKLTVTVYNQEGKQIDEHYFGAGTYTLSDLFAACYTGEHDGYSFPGQKGDITVTEESNESIMLRVNVVETPDDKEIATLTLVFNNGTSDKVSFKVYVGDNILDAIKEYGVNVPTYADHTFVGWSFNHTTEDAGDAGNVVNRYHVIEGDTTLYADWEKVTDDKDDNDDVVYDAVLKIYTNGTTSSAAKTVALDIYSIDGKITRSEVETVVGKYYKAADSKGMSFYGLFTADTWNGGKYDTDDAVSSVSLDADKTTYIYVMVKNATAISDGTTTTTKPADTTNPKTGDMIGVALAAMMSTGGAALTLIKKRKF